MQSMTSTDAHGDKHRHATPAALLEYANKVRAAGNAGLLDALLPSRRMNAKNCLIARALNFDSNVEPTDHYYKDDEPKWAMFPAFGGDEAKVRALAKSIGARTLREFAYEAGETQGRLGIQLPRLIGAAANAFDAGVPVFKDLVL